MRIFLTSRVRSTRTIFYDSATEPIAPGCEVVRFATTTRTNWRYECADKLLRTNSLVIDAALLSHQSNLEVAHDITAEKPDRAEHSAADERAYA